MFRRCVITTATILKTKIPNPCKFRNINISKNPVLMASVPKGDSRLLSGDPQGNIVTFEQFKNLMQGNEAVIIDVREPEELKEHGALPRSINIPLNDLETTLKSMSSEQFKFSYGCEKPGKNTLIVFSCMRGGRSTKAEDIAVCLGYKNVKNYKGGWTEWAEKNKK